VAQELVTETVPSVFKARKKDEGKSRFDFLVGLVELPPPPLLEKEMYIDILGTELGILGGNAEEKDGITPDVCAVLIVLTGLRPSVVDAELEALAENCDAELPLAAFHCDGMVEDTRVESGEMVGITVSDED